MSAGPLPSPTQSPRLIVKAHPATHTSFQGLDHEASHPRLG